MHHYKNPLNIQLVCCDLGNTLILNEGSQIVSKYIKQYSLPSSFFSEAFRILHLGPTYTEYFHKFLSKHNVSENIWKSFLYKLWRTEMRNDSLYSSLTFLKNTFGIPIIYTTENIANIANVISKFDLDSLIIDVIISSELGYLKTDINYWNAILKRFPHIISTSILVIDDSVEVGTVVTTLGMNFILYKKDVDILSLF